ncbi:MAG: hypothetical protein H6825_09415 [Planctomycetes bacterium]|nr:hypothetical protein [Planctomycetota bacterium]
MPNRRLTVTLIAGPLVMLASEAHAADPVPAGALSCAGDAQLHWTAEAADADGDLASLHVTLRRFADEAGCAGGAPVEKTVVLADEDGAGGAPMLVTSGAVAALEGHAYQLVVEATDAQGHVTTFESPCATCDTPADIEIVVPNGTPVPGSGNVVRTDKLSVDDDGNVYALVVTDTGDSGADECVLLNGVPILFEGQAVPEPSGTTVSHFLTSRPNGSSWLHYPWTCFLDGPGIDLTNDEAFFVGDSLVHRRGDIATLPGFTPGTIYSDFHPGTIDDHDAFVVGCVIDDPSNPPGIDSALVEIRLDPDGQIASEELLVKSGDTSPGLGGVVTSPSTGGPHNALGQLLMHVTMSGLDPASNEFLLLDDEVLAQSGTPSIVPGRNWLGVAPELDLSDTGRWVFSATIDGDPASDRVLVSDQGKLAQEGDTLPAIAGFHLGYSPFTRVFMGDNGDVLWYSTWDDPDTTHDAGLFLNDLLLVRKGDALDGQRISRIYASGGHVSMSPNGEWAVFTAEFDDTPAQAVRVWIGPWTYLGHGLAGSGDQTPVLRGKGSLTPGSTVRLELSHALPGTTTALVLGFSEISVPFRGGVLVPAPDRVLLGIPVDGTGAHTSSSTLPAGIPSATPIWFQAWVTDPGGPAGLSASNAVKGMIP